MNYNISRYGYMVNIQADEIHMKAHNYEWSPIGRELIHIISSILKKYEW